MEFALCHHLFGKSLLASFNAEKIGSCDSVWAAATVDIIASGVGGGSGSVVLVIKGYIGY